MEQFFLFLEQKSEEVKQAEKMQLMEPKMEDNQLELDLDLMRAIQLSLDQQACSSSTPDRTKKYDKHHRTSSSSSSVDDETSLQKPWNCHVAIWLKESVVRTLLSFFSRLLEHIL